MDHKAHFIANPQANWAAITHTGDKFAIPSARSPVARTPPTRAPAMFQPFFAKLCPVSGRRPAGLRSGPQVSTALALALSVPALLGIPPQALARGDWAALVSGFQARGIAVRSDHPRCAERDLEGLYLRGRREVVVCPRGDRSITLRHEGWHLVQTLCLAGRPWVAPETVARLLGRRDRREVEMLVPPAQWHREAEARVMARLAPERYFEQWDRACAGRLSPPPASPDPPVSSR